MTKSRPTASEGSPIRTLANALPYLVALPALPLALLWTFGLPGKPRWWEMAIWMAGFTAPLNYPPVLLVIGVQAWRAHRRGDAARAARHARQAWVALGILLLTQLPLLLIFLN